MCDSTFNTLFKSVSKPLEHSGTKVTVVGVGMVGMACAHSIYAQGICSELALIDVVADKLEGEVLDLQHGSGAARNIVVRGSTDYAVTAGSKICVVTAGARQNVGESRLSLPYFKDIIPNLVKYSPNAILLIVSNPVDILTWVAWKLSGLPSHRVIGSGTHLDSTRFRYMISQRLSVAPSSCHGWIIGEHGDSSVAVWSGVNVAGVMLKEINPLIGEENDPENWRSLHKEVVDSAYKIIEKKGYTNWAIGTVVAQIVNAMIKNQTSVFCLAVNSNGFHGVTQDVFLSLPCVLGEGGIINMIKNPLHESESAKLRKSAQTIAEVQSGVQF